MPKTAFDILFNLMGESDLNRVAHSLDDIENKIEDVSKRRKVSLDTSEIKNLNKEMQHLEHQKQKLMGMGKSGGGFFSSTAGKLGGLAAGFLAVDQIVSFGKDVMDTTAKYEKFRAVLTTSFGSAGMADKAMNDIIDFASKTPFQVDELTDSFVKLKNSGFTPTMSDMTSMGDLAASTGKNFDQLTEGLMDATMGEWERMKEFGVKAKQAGDKVSITFHGQTKTIDNTAASVRNYILSLGQMAGVTGSMASISKTTGGQLSNLSDNFDMLKASIGERMKPSMGSFIGGLSSMIGLAKEWVEIPTSEKLVDQKIQVNMLAGELMDASVPEERRLEIYKELNNIAPEVLKNIDAQSINVNQLKTNLEDYNKQLERQIALEVNKDKLKPLIKKQSDAWSDLIELQRNFELSLGKAASGKHSGSSAMTDLVDRRNKAIYPLFLSMRKEGKSFDEILAALLAKENEIGGTVLSSSVHGLGRKISQYKSLKSDYENTKKDYADQANILNSMVDDSEKLTNLDKNKPNNPFGNPTAEVIGDATKSKIVTINIQTLKAADSLVMNNEEGLSISAFADKLTDVLMTAVNDATFAIQ